MSEELFEQLAERRKTCAVGFTMFGRDTKDTNRLFRNSFRLDINALRALSVLAVLGYHLKLPGFAGGFVGVDVFLVITGYLMTGKVLTDLAAGRYSLWSFGMMRMRRIYPALAVVVLSTAVVGWFVTLPGEVSRHLRQACYALVALSNFAFDADNGYFAMAAQTKPLLHTWSLAIEWQFYIWMPLVVALVWRHALPSKSRSSVMMGAFLAVGFVSLAWCLWQSHSDMMGSAFFSLRARAWEPLAGGLIAVSEFRRRTEDAYDIPRLITTAAAIGGWALVAACIIYPLPETQWPGALTVLPILGAALIIAARQQAHGLLGVPLISTIVNAVRTVKQNATALGIVGAIALFWTSLSLFSVLESAFNIVYGRPNRPFLRGKALALAAADRAARDALRRAAGRARSASTSSSATRRASPATASSRTSLSVARLASCRLRLPRLRLLPAHQRRAAARATCCPGAVFRGDRCSRRRSRSADLPTLRRDLTGAAGLRRAGDPARLALRDGERHRLRRRAQLVDALQRERREEQPRLA